MQTRLPTRRTQRTAALLAGVLLVSSACQSSGSDATPLIDSAYVAATDAVCADTNGRLDALPAPPDGISATDWANEIALAFSAEAERTGDLLVDRSIRGTHLDFVTTTAELADRYRTLSETVVADPDGIGEISTEITELSLGRNDLAAELGLVECVRSDA